jgi:phage baseplate assembly protein W
MEEDWAGTDFSLGEDLGNTNQGDYATVSSRENVDIAVKRRMNTPLGDLWYDQTYGNRIFDYLSDPMDEKFVVNAEQSITECLSYEERIILLGVDVVLLNEERTARFFVQYKYNDGTDDIKTMQGVITDAGLSIPE